MDLFEHKMDDKTNCCKMIDEEIGSKETITQVKISVSTTTSKVVCESPQLLQSGISSFSSVSEDDKSIFTSTPYFPDGSDENNSVPNLRIRKNACHRVHYSSDLDESKHICFEEKIKKKSGKRQKRMSLLQSISTKSIENDQINLDTLENHLFPDMSFSESEISFTESNFNTSSNTDISWSKLQGIDYSSKYDFSGDELDFNRSINHPNRSIYRQKRRDWYLNRRNGTRTIIKVNRWQRYVKSLFQILFLVVYCIYAIASKTIYYLYKTCSILLKLACLPFLWLYKLIILIYESIKSKLTSFSSSVISLFISKPAKEVVTDFEDLNDGKMKQKSCSYMLFWFVLVSAVFSVLLISFNEEDYMSEIIAPIPNPMKSGIANAYPVYITVENIKIPAWHIFPNLPSPSMVHPVRHSLKDKAPVVLYLRQEGAVDSPKLKNLYQTLSSLGYHIVVPTNILSQYDVLKTWKWIKAQTNATAYLWGYDMNAAALTVTAKLFCKNLIPPNGVLIAKEITNNNVQQSMEIWSCNCALSAGDTGNTTDFKYNHVKCPIAFNNDVNDVYSQVVACIETVNRDVK